MLVKSPKLGKLGSGPEAHVAMITFDLKNKSLCIGRFACSPMIEHSDSLNCPLLESTMRHDVRERVAMLLIGNRMIVYLG